MRFPKEWQLLEMYPDEVFELQVAEYEPGHEESAEHYRNGAFHWWLARKPSKEHLLNLARLITRDPEQQMAEHLKTYVRQATHFDSEIEVALSDATSVSYTHLTLPTIYSV